MVHEEEEWARTLDLVRLNPDEASFGAGILLAG